MSLTAVDTSIRPSVSSTLQVLVDELEGAMKALERYDINDVLFHLGLLKSRLPGKTLPEPVARFYSEIQGDRDYWRDYAKKQGVPYDSMQLSRVLLDRVKKVQFLYAAA